MKFEIDTEKKIITLRESVKLSDFLKELMYLNITIQDWSLDVESVTNYETIDPQRQSTILLDPNHVTCEK